MTARLEGQVALVTGASRGLGRAIVELLSMEGAAVAVVDLKAHWAQATVDAVTASGGRAVAMAADVGDLQAYAAAVAATVERFGRLDVLVNNAMWNRYDPIEKIAPETVRRMTSVGLDAIAWGLQAAVPVMRAQGGGAVVNIASLSGLLGMPNALLYCGIKAAVIGMTRAAATELGPDQIRVNAVAPSTVDTEGVRAVVSEERIASRVSQTPLRRLGTPEDIARAVLFLASSESAFVTGQVLAVDGGLAYSLT